MSKQGGPLRPPFRNQRGNRFYFNIEITAGGHVFSVIRYSAVLFSLEPYIKFDSQ